MFKILFRGMCDGIRIISRCAGRARKTKLGIKKKKIQKNVSNISSNRLRATSFISARRGLRQMKSWVGRKLRSTVRQTIQTGE